jgi:hypothetical protein
MRQEAVVWWCEAPHFWKLHRNRSFAQALRFSRERIIVNPGAENEELAKTAFSTPEMGALWCCWRIEPFDSR